jgi:ankyrin repeat protein
VTRLLAAGADPNASVGVPNGPGQLLQTTALIIAAVGGRLEAARRLLEGGAAPSLAGGDGITPLMKAAGGGQLEVLQLLLGRGAAVDAVHPRTGVTAFHSACFGNQAECAEALAHAGCDVGLKTETGETGRELAQAKGHGEVAARLRAVVSEQLRAAGSTPAPAPAAVAGDEGPVDQLAQAAVEGDGAAVSQLLAAGADPNASVGSCRRGRRAGPPRCMRRRGPASWRRRGCCWTPAPTRASRTATASPR